MIDITLPRHAHDTMHGATKLAKFQNQVNTSKGKLMVNEGKVNLVPNWEQHGRAFVTSGDKKLCGNNHDYALSAASAHFLEHLNTRAKVPPSN